MLRLWRQSINACRENSLHRGWNLDSTGRLDEAIISVLADQDLRLEQGADGFLDEERVTTLDKQLLKRGKALVFPEQHLQQVSRALWRQRVQPLLAVVGLARP